MGMGALHLRLLCLAAAALLVAGCQLAPRLAAGSAPTAATATPMEVATAADETPALPPLAYASTAVPDNPRHAALVLDAGSGRVLLAENADALRHPASLTKMMTLYLLFEELDSGRLSWGTALPVSAEAARQPPSKLGLVAGETIAVRDAVLALSVRSANDVAVVVAEAIAGSEEAFARRMTATARRLGMSRTIFTNASGLPDAAQVTTAREIALLARSLQSHYSRYYAVFSQKSFEYGGRTHRSTNRLLETLNGMDGIKTGYIRASGHNLVASVRRGNRRILVIVFGGTSREARDGYVAALAEAHLPSRAFAATYPFR
jgi:D-alanyl-D-alanine carboxypeptidase